MLRFSTHGDSFSRGQQQGQATRPLALPWMEQRLGELRQRFSTTSQERLLAQVRPQIESWRRQLEKLHSEGAAECCGLAAGLGLDESTYFCIVFYHRLCGLLPQCTVLGCRDEDGRPLLGKTDDIYQEELGMNVLEIARSAVGYCHVHFHFAGTIWTVAGMNECGLAMGMTGIPGPPLEEEGLFSLVALHTILPACADIGEAVAHIRSLRLNAYGFSLILGDRTGALALVEKTGAGTQVFAEEHGLLVHTNHILDPDFALQNPEQSAPLDTNGRRRYDNALSLLRSGEKLEAVLRNRAPRGAICQRGEEGLHTDFAVVFAPVEKQLRFWAGYPDQVEVETLDMETIFR